MLSLAKPHQYYQIFLAQGIGMGIGMGLLFLPAISVTSHYFRRRRAAAMGVVLAGKSFTYLTFALRRPLCRLVARCRYLFHHA